MFYLIKTKRQSDEFIAKNNLNCFDELYCPVFDEAKIDNFIKAHPEYNDFSLRGKTAGGESIGSNKNRHISALEVKERTVNFKNFSIVATNSEWVQHKKVTGAIKVEILDNDITISFEGSNNPKFSTRDAMNAGEISINGSIFDRKIHYLIKHTPFVDKIIDYIFEKELFGYIVELRYYDIPVGKNKENVIVTEVRSNY